MVKAGVLSFAHMHAGGYAHGLKLLKNVDFVGFWDDNEERAKKVSEIIQKPWFRDIDELLSKVDAVVVTTANVHHKEVTIKAANAKKHVMCEKPISVSMEDAQAMIDVCKKNNVKLMTAFPCRFSPAVMRAQQLVADGKLGDIIAIAGTNRGSMPGGWFVDKALSGGGAVMDHTVHVADLIRWFTGANFTEVYAEIDKKFHPELECDDCGTLSMKMEKNIICSLDPSWSRNPKYYPTWGDVTMRILGTKGAVNVDMFNQKFNLYSIKDTSMRYQYWGSNTDAGLVASFIDSVENDKPVFISGEDGMAAMELALGAYKSAETGKPIQLPFV